jgi:hypothetical protein
VTSTGRRVRQTWPAALAIATAANLALLSLLAFPGRYALPLAADVGPAPVDVSVFPPLVLTSPVAPRAPVQAGAAPTRPTASPPTASPSLAPPAEAATPSAGAPPGASANSDLAAALRRGPVGCANQGAWMSDADREACRHRLAAGAASAAHLWGMAPEKLAYYDALAKAEDDWRTGRNPGHLPFLFCGAKLGQGQVRDFEAPPHALKLGPCYLEPPMGALSITVDVPPPEDMKPDAVTPAGADPIRHQGQ